MKVRYAYLVIQDDRTWPVKSHNDTQRHVLGCHTNLNSAMKHLRSCVQGRWNDGLDVIRDTPYTYPKGGRSRSDEKEWSVYMSRPDKSNTCEFTVERHTLTK